jgi:hypothetical protein
MTIGPTAGPTTLGRGPLDAVEYALAVVSASTMLNGVARR